MIRILIHWSRFDYIMTHCDWKSSLKMSKQCWYQAVVYDLDSLKIRHYINNSADKLSQNLILKFLSNLFEQYWQITKHTDVAAITSKWEMQLKCTLALYLDTLKLKTWKSSAWVFFCVTELLGWVFSKHVTIQYRYHENNNCVILPYRFFFLAQPYQ